MDALSDLLRVVKLSGGVFLDAELTEPWCLAARVGKDDCRLAMVEPRHVMAFHYVVEGHMQLQLEGQRPVAVGADALALVPRNEPHLIGSDVRLPPVDGDALLSSSPDGALATIRHGGGGAVARIVCGFVGAEAMPLPLLELLSRLLVFDLKGRPEAAYVAQAFRQAAHELTALRPGAAVALAKLSELIFIEAVRAHAESLPADGRGWLAALRDPKIGRALALLHRHVERPWTTEMIAREVHMSRSAFAERFAQFVGKPPMGYLADWRMELAAQRLTSERVPVAAISSAVGYESEAAFSRAFKRAFGVSPAHWRRASQMP
jgi:AraC-like DNA-binding protein